MYFKGFPQINYEFPDGAVRAIKDISIRPNLVKKYFEEPSNFQEYEIIDGDTPENIANKVYGSPFLHWVVILSSQRFNIYKQWPKSSIQFESYIMEKYRVGYDSEGKEITLPDDEVNEVIEFTGSASNGFEGVTDSGAILKPHHFVDSSKNKYSWDTALGGNVDAFGRAVVQPTLTPVSIYQYEFELNERDKTILIPKPPVANRINNELKQLLNE